MRNNFEVVRRDRELFELWWMSLFMPVVLGLPNIAAWFFKGLTWGALAFRIWLMTALLSRAARGKDWARVVFGLIMAFEAAIGGLAMMSAQLPMTGRAVGGVTAAFMAWLSARAFRIVGATRATNEA